MTVAYAANGQLSNQLKLEITYTSYVLIIDDKGMQGAAQ